VTPNDPSVTEGDAPRTDDQPDRREAAAYMQAFLQMSRDTQLSGTLTGPPVTLGFSSAATLPIPQGIPGYEILGELGRGGMGVVYKARQTGLKRVVALKMVLAGGHAGPEQVARFRAEAEAVARLRHPGIVQVFDIGEHEGRPYFSMEFVDGPSLAQELARELPPPRTAAALVAGLAVAVHAAHQQGVIHRDLKPGNILLGRDEFGSNEEAQTPVGIQSSFLARHTAFQPKIADFGLAKQVQGESDLTHTGAVLGTPCYMAPEQAAGDATAVGPVADVYALGGILYECLTGRPPFRGATLADTLDQVLRTDPIPPSRLQAGIPRDLEVICLKCLRKEPNRRYASAAALADDLRRFLEGQAILARPAGVVERGWRWCRRKPAVAALLAVVAATLLGGTGGVLYFAIQADREADRATGLRIAAEGAAAKEAEASRQAQTAAEGLRRSLTRLHITTGNRFLEATPPDRAPAAWWFARAWEGEDESADAQTEAGHRLRVGFALAQGPQLVGACFHRRPVADALFDPSGKFVLTRTDSPVAQLWDPFKGEPIAQLEHPRKVTASAVRPAGGQAATGSEDGAVRLWDLPTGRLLRTIPQGGPVLFVSYERGGKLLVAATAAGAVHFWNPDTGESAAPSLKLAQAVYAVGFSPDGRRAVTADAGHAARVWEVDTGKPVAGPLPHRDHRTDDEVAIAYRCWPAFHPKRPLLAVVHPQRVVRVWNLDTGKVVGNQFEFRTAVHQVRFTPDGSRLLAHVGNTINALALDGTPAILLRHPRESPRSCLSPDGKTLATCSTGGVVHLWNAVTYRKIGRPLRCADGVQSLAFSPDGRQLLAASHDGTARVWRIDGRLPERKYDYDCGRADRVRLSDAIGQRVFDPTGKRELRFGKAGAWLRDRTGAAAVSLPHGPPVVEARFTPNGRRVITRDGDGTLRLWDAVTGEPVGRPIPRAPGLIDMAPSADGERVLLLEPGASVPRDERVVTVWEFATAKPVFGPKTGWDSGRQTYGSDAIARQVSRAALSPDGTRVVLASNATGALGVWDVDSGNELGRTIGYRGELYGLRFTSDGKRFLTNASDTIARLWDATTAAPAGPPLRHPRFCSLADVSEDGVRVVTVDSGDAIRFWDGLTGDQFGRFETSAGLSVESVWLSADGRRLILNRGAVVADLPSYQGPAAGVRPLLRLLTGFDQDADGNVGEVGHQTFLADPDGYRRVWRAWVERSEERR
jgi:eukaryotic-like serine/threonine-protein kinase